MQMIVHSYAKANVGLKVTGRREDGYHTISSYFLLLPFYDEINVSIEEGPYSVSIKGNESYIGSKEDLMEKSARLFSLETGLSFSLKIEIKKNIPLQAGLGGGSSDAASVLIALNNYFKYFSQEELIDFSQLVGADVPFFTSGYKCAYVSGIGERVEEREWLKEYKYVSLFRAKGSGVSTIEAYRKLDEYNLNTTPLSNLVYPLKRSEFPNDFELIEGKSIFDEIKNTIKEDDYLSLSGSGSVWFLLSKEPYCSKSEYFLSCKKII